MRKLLLILGNGFTIDFISQIVPNTIKGSTRKAPKSYFELLQYFLNDNCLVKK